MHTRNSYKEEKKRNIINSKQINVENIYVKKYIKIDSIINFLTI